NLRDLLDPVVGGAVHRPADGRAEPRGGGVEDAGRRRSGRAGESQAGAEIPHHHLGLGADLRAVLDPRGIPLDLARHAAEPRLKAQMSQNPGRAAPFSAWEREIAVRYLRARRVDGGLALIAVISFVGTTLAVMALIVVMAIMNGFRADLTR